MDGRESGGVVFTLGHIHVGQLQTYFLLEQRAQRDHAHFGLRSEAADDALHAEPGCSAPRTLHVCQYSRSSGTVDRLSDDRHRVIAVCAGFCSSQQTLLD